MLLVLALGIILNHYNYFFSTLEEQAINSAPEISFYDAAAFDEISISIDDLSNKVDELAQKEERDYLVIVLYPSVLNKNLYNF